MVKIIVVRGPSEPRETVELDLTFWSLEQHFQKVLTFCYYVELDERTVLTAMKPTDPRADWMVFVKLVDDEPVDLEEEYLLRELESHPEFIPDNI